MISDLSKVVPAWRPVRSVILDRDIQVRRPTISDVQLPIVELWARLVRDGDGSALFPMGFKASEADPKLVEEICALATANPTQAGD